MTKPKLRATKAATVPIEIIIEDVRWKLVRGLKSKAVLAHELSLLKAQREKMTTLLLSNDAEVKLLNKQWRGKDKATNVLSFPAAEFKAPKGEVKPLGDIIMSFETCAEEAMHSGKIPLHHATHLIVHGLLHLIGFDHENDTDAERMEAKEIKLLAKLGIANPYMLSSKND